MNERYHRIRVQSIDEWHDSGYRLLKVYARKWDDKDWEYLGLHDIVNIEFGNRHSIAIDTTEPNAIFEIGSDGDSLELVWNMDSIRFEIERE